MIGSPDLLVYTALAEENAKAEFELEGTSIPLSSISASNTCTGIQAMLELARERLRPAAKLKGRSARYR